MNTKDINLLELVGIIGAIIMVVSVFLIWGIVEVTSGTGILTMDWSGWEIFNKEADMTTDAYYAPVIALVCGILAIISAIVPMFMTKPELAYIFDIMNMAVIVLGVIAIVCMAVFYNSFVDSVDIGMTIESAKVGTGFWLCLAGGIITVVGGILPVIRKLMV